MRFQGLPAELRVGAADLTPVHKSSPILNVCICTGCDRAGPSFFICKDGHVICESCAVIEWSVTSLGWCPTCDRPVQLSAGGIPINVFSEMLFQCKCGFEGTLALLRNHLLTEVSHMHAGGHPSMPSGRRKRNVTLDLMETNMPLVENIRTEPNCSTLTTSVYAIRNSKVDVSAIKKKLLAIIKDIDEAEEPPLMAAADQADDRMYFVNQITAVAKSVNDIMTWLITREQQLDEIFRNMGRGEAELSGQETACSHGYAAAMQAIRDVQQEVRAIEQKIVADRKSFVEKLITSHLQTEISQASVKLSGEIASSNTAFFWFNFDALYQSYRLTGAFVESEWQYKVIAGICFGVNIEIDKIDDEVYLGLYAAPKDQIQTDAPWPLRRTIILSVHDREGTVVESRSYNSFMYGKYSGGYFAPSDTSAAGYKNFVQVSSLCSNYCIVKGLLCVSIVVEPMKQTKCPASSAACSGLNETAGTSNW